MTRDDLINGICQAGARMEGFYLTQEQTQATGATWPTLAQTNCNPGNIRRWSSRGEPYPQRHGYVDFRAWAGEDEDNSTPKAMEVAGLTEGWRVFRVLVGQYLDNKYTAAAVAKRIAKEITDAHERGDPTPMFPEGHDSPTLYEMYGVYAPSADANHPKAYAEFVAKSLGVPPDKPLKELIS